MMKRGGAPIFALAVLSVLFLVIHEPASAETLLERGTYLMKSVVACGNCHTPKTRRGKDIQGMELAGGLRIEEPGFIAYPANITPDKETGIGNWTDEQIVTAFREGRRPDGTVIRPPMPIEWYRMMSDRDAKAIVAYLRSVKPVKNKVPEATYKIPLPVSYGPPVVSVADVSRNDRRKYGAYLVTIGHCTQCHTPMVRGQHDFSRIGAGGFALIIPWGTVYSANITPDKKTGIGNWTDRQVKLAITNGQRATGGKMLPPMPYPYFLNIKRADLDAIVAHIRTFKAQKAVRKVRHVPPKKK